MLGNMKILPIALSIISSFSLYSAENDKHFTSKDFFENAGTTNYQLSKDGKYIAFMKSTSLINTPSRLNIYYQPVSKGSVNGKASQVTNETMRDISGFFWKGSDTIIYIKDDGGDENYKAYALNIFTGKEVILASGKGTKTDVIDILEGDADHILLSNNQRDRSLFDVIRVNIRTGKSETILQNPGGVVTWVTDHTGDVRVAIKNDGLNRVLLYRKNEDSEFKSLIETDYKHIVLPLFFSTDNKTFYAISNRGRDKAALVLINPQDPQQETVVFENPEVDIAYADWSEKNRKLLTVNWIDEKENWHFFDERIAFVKNSLEKLLPGYMLRLSSDYDENTFIVKATSDRNPGTYFLYDASNSTLTKLSNSNYTIPEYALSSIKPIAYTSRDGLKIHGYLTLPQNREPRNLPCIINPHGGPEVRDVWEYNPEVQFLAYQGYCVLQMNFRGSTGYGRNFWQAGYGQWGLKMQDDITDGVHWLIKQGIADPSRIGIYGTSYGGYAALAGITFTPDLYAAAVDYVGISSLFTILKNIPPYWRVYLEQQYAMIGHPERDKERLEATSPLLHVDRIKTPLFIAQGANDPRVNKLESDQMVAALKKRGVTVEYMVKDNEGHGFENEENRIEFYKAMQVFLATHLKSDTN